MFLHHIQLFLTQHSVLTNDLHDLEGIAVRKTFADKEVHDIVTAGYDLIDSSSSFPQQFLRIIRPYIGSVGKA